LRSNTGWTFAGHPSVVRSCSVSPASAAGWLTAWDPVRQREAWRVPYSRPGSGGTLVTAGNIVFQGTAEQTAAAYRADDRREALGHAGADGAHGRDLITYTVDGEQYIAVNAGWGGGMAAVERHGRSGHAAFAGTAGGVQARRHGRAAAPGTGRVRARTAAADHRVGDTIQRGATLYSEVCAGLPRSARRQRQ
jgi:quinohemoprotein ethanol dehydrogenase